MLELIPIEPEMILIAEGDFLMGSEAGSKIEKPVHLVWIDSFTIAKYPVTKREYAVFLELTQYNSPPQWNMPEFQIPNQPVVGTSWYDAVNYCSWLSQLTGKIYRLPTEGEREKASRGGLLGYDYPCGNLLPADCHGGRNSILKPVGSEGPNNYGLFNMSEGVHEWCADWYSGDYYRQSPCRNPKGPEDGTRKVARGGSWRHRVCYSRCASRSSLAPEKTFSDFGFRCAMDVD